MADKPLQKHFSDLAAFYRTELFEHVMPFWMEHGLDRESGGWLCCIAKDGTVLSREKYMWQQLRALWIFAKLHNRFGQEQPWLDVAHRLFDYVVKHGRDDKGRWHFRLAADGSPIDGPVSIYADMFAIYALTEYARATASQEAEALAMDTYREVTERLESGEPIPITPYAIPEGHICHGISMMMTLVCYELGTFTKNAGVIETAMDHSRLVLDAFRRPELEILLEYVSADGHVLDTPAGRAIVPGHAIESMWFQIQLHQLDDGKDRIAQSCECIRWHMERGWDPEYGGLLLGLDLAGEEPYWERPDLKLWWPMTEALYALLLAYEHCGESWCLDWHQKVHDWSFDHFPNREQGDWHQHLDRTGKPLPKPPLMPVKDPFHLPRALIYCIDVCERLGKRG